MNMDAEDKILMGICISLILFVIIVPYYQWRYVVPKYEKIIEGTVVNYEHSHYWMGKIIPRTRITFATYGESEKMLIVRDHWDFTIGKVYRITHKGGYPHFYRYVVETEEM